MPFGNRGGDLSRTDYEAVIRAGIERHLDVLHCAISDPDPVTRALALGGLHRAGELTEAIVAAALADADREVRCRAIELTVPFHDIELDGLLDDTDDLVVETAAWALGERASAEPSTITRLIAVATGHSVSICREAAVAALGAIGSEAGLPAILAALDDRAPVRRRAVLALAPFDGPDVDSALRRALADRDRQVRQAAEDLL